MMLMKATEAKRRGKKKMQEDGICKERNGRGKEDGEREDGEKRETSVMTEERRIIII